MKAKLEKQREKEADMMKPPYWHADFCPVKVRTVADSNCHNTTQLTTKHYVHKQSQTKFIKLYKVLDA